MTPRAAQWGRVGGGGRKKGPDETCFHWRDASVLSDDKREHILAAEWMNETRKKNPNNLRISPPLTLSTQESGRPRVALESKSPECFPPSEIASRRRAQVGDGDHTGRHLDGKVPHTVLSSCIAPSAGLQRHHWTYETALHMNGERESPAWSLAFADPSCKRQRHPSPDTLNYIILHNV